MLGGGEQRAGGGNRGENAAFNMPFSHLRTPEQYGQYCRAYEAAGGTGKIAANRPG